MGVTPRVYVCVCVCVLFAAAVRSHRARVLACGLLGESSGQRLWRASPSNFQDLASAPASSSHPFSLFVQRGSATSPRHIKKC